MSIFSSIAKGVKSVASKVYSGVNSVGNAITSAVGLGSSTANTASALQGTYTGAPLNSGTAGYTNSSGGVGVSQYGPTAVVQPQTSTSSSFIGPLPVQGPPKPTSFGSGTTVSNTSSPSYSSNLTLGSSNLSSQAPINTTVSANTLGAGNNTNLISSSPSAKNYTGQVMENNISNGADIATGMFLPKVSATTGQDTSGNTNPDGTPKKTAIEKLLESLKPAASQADSYIRARNESGLLQAEQQKNNTQNQINGITAKLNQDLLSLRETASTNGVTEAVYGGQQAQISREATIRLLPLQAQLASDQNNLEQAQSHLDTLFKIYSTDAQNSVDYYNEQAKKVYEDATANEKRQFDEIAKQKDFQLSLVKSENDTHQSEMTQALKDGNTRLYSALSTIVPPTNINSRTYAKDYQKYLTDRANAVKKYGVPQQIGDNSPLYSGLNSATATAVRQQVSAFKAEPSVQNFVTIQEGRNFAKSLSDTTENPVDDQGLIYSLAKVLDPGSVVREGEYNTVQKYSQSWASAYGKGVTQAIAGTGFLSEKARKDIKKTIESRYVASEKTYDNVLNQYKEGINSLIGRDGGDKFLRDYKTSQGSGESSDNDPLEIL